MDADQLDAVVVVPRDQGVRYAAHVKGGDAMRAVELQVRVVAERVGRPQGAVFGDADQLDAVAGRGGDDCIGTAAHHERVDAVGPSEQVKAALAVPGLARSLQRAAFVHSYQLDGVVAVRGHRGVRAAPDYDRVGVQRVG